MNVLWDKIFFRINHYSKNIKKHLMAINLILSNKNIEQFGNISSGEIFVPDDIIHPGISVSALIYLQFLNHIIIIKTKVLLFHQAWVIIADFDYLVQTPSGFYASKCF